MKANINKNKKMVVMKKIEISLRSYIPPHQKNTTKEFLKMSHDVSNAKYQMLEAHSNLEV